MRSGSAERRAQSLHSVESITPIKKREFITAHAAAMNCLPRTQNSIRGQDGPAFGLLLQKKISAQQQIAVCLWRESKSYAVDVMRIWDMCLTMGRHLRTKGIV